MIKYIYLYLSILLLCACTKHSNTPKVEQVAKVEIKEENGKFEIYRNGKPYNLNGVAGEFNLKKAASLGANSVRTWDTDNIEEVLDEAYQFGMTVTVGLEIGKEYWGDEFDYWDNDAVEEKIQDISKIINQFKDHPALLMWGIGNEVHLFGGNRFIVLRTIDKIAEVVKEIDPNHPVMTVMPHGPNFNKMGIMHLICPNIDVLGINTFAKLPKLYDEFRTFWSWRKAYIVTEWATPGPWDERSTEWGAKREPSSTEKAALVRTYWAYIERDQNRCVGAYAFYWGEKFERTHTYVSLLLEDSLITEYAIELQKIWKGSYQGNHAPVIDSLRLLNETNLENVYLKLDTDQQIAVYAHDPEGDSLQYRWEIRNESFSDFTPGYYNADYEYLLDSAYKNKLDFSVPEAEGGYRIFCYVYDSHGHVATVNLPFYALLIDKDFIP